MTNVSHKFLFLTLYMFRAHRAHHQERQIVSIQPLVAVGDRVLCRSEVHFRPAQDTATDTEWQLPEVVLTQIVSPDDEHHALETSKSNIKVFRDGPRWPQGFRVGKGPGLSWRFGTTRVVGRQPKAPAAFTPGEIPGTHFKRLSQPQSTLFCR